jgi:hypothetical protein
VFGDAGKGKVNRGPGSVGAAISEESLRDWGASLQFNLPDRFYARVTWAKKISPSDFTQAVDPDTSHFYGSIGLAF